MGRREVTCRAGNEPKCIPQPNVRAAVFAGLGSGWEGGQGRWKSYDKLLTGNAFPRACHCLRNDGVRCSSHLSGTTPFRSLGRRVAKPISAVPRLRSQGSCEGPQRPEARMSAFDPSQTLAGQMVWDALRADSPTAVAQPFLGIRRNRSGALHEVSARVGGACTQTCRPTPST